MISAREFARFPFDNGDVMSRQEFHALASDREDLERVELIEGIVYLPTPIPTKGHSDEHMFMLVWLGAYESARKGLHLVPMASVLLDDQNEPQPDVLLMREDRVVIDDGYLASAPELVVEIAASSASRDLHQKKRAYERNGIREYIVWRTRDEAIDWFRLVDGAYQRVAPDADGIIESEEFPGLRLDVPAMLAQDRERVLAALE